MGSFLLDRRKEELERSDEMHLFCGSLFSRVDIVPSIALKLSFHFVELVQCAHLVFWSHSFSRTSSGSEKTKVLSSDIFSS